MGLTLFQLCARTGEDGAPVDYRLVRRWEQGKFMPSMRRGVPVMAQLESTLRRIESHALLTLAQRMLGDEEARRLRGLLADAERRAA